MKKWQNRSKMAKISLKMAKIGNFHRFLDIFPKFNNFAKSLTPEMKDLKSFFHIK